jgi:hypothetical protein
MLGFAEIRLPSKSGIASDAYGWIACGRVTALTCEHHRGRIQLRGVSVNERKAA